MSTVGEGGAGQYSRRASLENVFAQVGGYVEWGTPQGNDLPLLAAAFEPLHMVVFREVDKAINRVAVAEYAAPVVAELVLRALIVALLDERTEALGDFFEWPREDVVTEVGLVDALDRLF